MHGSSANADARAAYLARFRKVLEHIDAHGGDDLQVDALSQVAAFSKHHFHRQFSALYGIAVYKYVQLVRMKRAAYQLAFRADTRILDIALDSGYESHEAFARAFKRLVGQTPSEFREQPAWAVWHETSRPLTTVRSEHMKPDNRAAAVRIVDFPETRVAALEHRAAADAVGDTVRRFIAWRKANNVLPGNSDTFNINYFNPPPPDNEYHVDVCAAIDRAVADNPFGVVEKTIPAGRCAVLRHVGSDDTLPDSVTYLYSTWLPSSREELRDFPLYFQRVHFFPDVPEHEAITDVFLPLR